MDIRVLRYFLMVAREENITKAAKILHVTQPTLSRQLMQLEEELGVKLFNRSNHNLEKFGAKLEAWAPFAKGQNGIFTHPVLTEIGNKYNKKPGQVALRFLIQSGVTVIPKSTHKERMAENLNVFDFTLDNDDMKIIESLDEGKNIFMDHEDPASIERFFGMFGIS